MTFSPSDLSVPNIITERFFNVYDKNIIIPNLFSPKSSFIFSQKHNRHLEVDHYTVWSLQKHDLNYK